MRIILFLALIALALPAAAQETMPRVRLAHDVNAERIDVFVDGQPFTAYLYTDELPVLKKPVLFPVRTASGRTITRGYPLQPRAGETVDHPHQVGLWFNYGDVNGLDFWNNSDVVPREDAGKMGTIRHRAIRTMQGGSGTGVLETTSDWLNPGGETLLRETTRYEFHAHRGGARAIDRITTLAALDEPVRFRDSKEGVFGLRVARELEHPADAPVILTDANGEPAAVPVVNNEGVTGRYRTSEGREGHDAWGTRGRWTLLSGTVEGGPVTVAIFDHPQNVGYPTYWMARGYGLFAANPLGQEVFSGDTERLNFALAPNASVTFRHRVLLYDTHPTPEKVDADWKAFARRTP